MRLLNFIEQCSLFSKGLKVLAITLHRIHRRNYDGGTIHSFTENYGKQQFMLPIKKEEYLGRENNVH